MKHTLLLFLVFVLNQTTHAALPPSFQTGRTRFTAEVDYFSTKSNYDEFGESRELFGSNSYKVISNKIDGTMYFDGQWALGAGVGLAYAESDTFGENRTNSELTDLHFIAMKQLSFGAFRLIPEFEGLLALTEVDEKATIPNDDEVMTNEGAHSAKVGSWAALSTGPIRIYGYGGYQYRADGRSALGHWLGGLDWRMRPFIFSSEMAGYQSVSDDEYTDQRINRTIVSSTVNGGSLKYYGVDPNLVTGKLELAHLVNADWSWKVGYIKTLSGESAAEGQSVVVGLAYNINPPRSRQTAPPRHRGEGTKSRKSSLGDEELEPTSPDKTGGFQPDLEETTEEDQGAAADDGDPN